MSVTHFSFGLTARPELSVQQIFVFVYLLTKIYPLAASANLRQ